MLLFDINHGLKNTDVMLMDMLHSHHKKFIIVFTKCDRAAETHYSKAIEACQQIQHHYDNMSFYVHFTSSAKEAGIDELRKHLMFKIIAN